MSVNQAYALPFRSIGRDVVVHAMARIIGPETVALGDSIIIDDFVFLMGGQDTRLGSFIHIGAFSSLVGGGRLVMEDFAGLSGGVRVYTGNEDYLGGGLTNPAVPAPYRVPIRSFVHIGMHAIVGANSVILPGVTIGQGAVIGANSLVTKDCAPWTISIGSPARPLRERPRDTILAKERELRAALYDASGKYIPRAERR